MPSGGSGGGFNPLGLAVGGGGAGCSRTQRPHSFDPKTRVLMADGSTRPIEDVNVGDKVLATDPVAGTSEPKRVTQLHRNNDKDLTDVTVRDQDGKVTKVETTWHHPFWNASERKWSDAKDLKPGTRLLVRGKGAVTVVAVLNKLGAEEMRDLTVADIHTYYVLAGAEPVLVHNNNLPRRSNEFCEPTLFVFRDGATSSPQQIASSRGRPTGGTRQGQADVRQDLLDAAGDGPYQCWRCGERSPNPDDMHMGHINVPTSKGGNLEPENCLLEGAACNLSSGNRGGPKDGRSCAERGGCGAPYGRYRWSY
ncbi:polymorphic toxin-type HINT domain-containing protein [Micromonospora sp. NPDC049366]|uniref:polymorphic toxin-type HINT domain-containing protein n=1 Tax=Micromonospora sp. NPDC049366 TaxID=3364271 RepID=UPI00378A3931